MTRKKKRRKPARSIIEALEPRILFSADAFSVALDYDNGSDPLADALEQARQEYDALVAESKLANAQRSALELASVGDDQDVLASSSEQDDATRELVFVDTDTPDYQQLVDDLIGNTDESRQFDVILLDNSSDGIAQITAALSRYSELDAVHIISHGEDGAIYLGATQLDQQSLLANSDAIGNWSNAFSVNGDLLIYGCNLAATSDGELLVNRLAAITGADVAASDDLTGSAALGGDWDLEYFSGVIETSASLSVEMQQSWAGLLASPDGSEIDINTTTANIQTTTKGFASAESVAMDANGNSIVVWQSDLQDGSATGVYATRFDADGNALDVPGSPGITEFLVNTTTANDQREPTVAMDDAGNYVIVWTGNGTGDSEGIFFRRYDAAGNALDATEQLINTTVSGQQRNPAVAMDADGDFVVAWAGEGTGDTDGIFYRRFDAAGVAQDVTEVRVNTVTDQAQRLPAIAMDDVGNFVVGWDSDDDSSASVDNNVYFQQYTAGGSTIGINTQVNTNATTMPELQQNSSIAIDGAGNFTITWESDDDTSNSDDFNIHFKQYNSSGGVLISETLVNTNTAEDQTYSSVAAADDGRFTITWTSDDDGSNSVENNIYIQEYTSSGIKFGPETLVNSTTALDQQASSVAMSSTGEYLVAWNGNGTGDADGIFGQLFMSAGTLVVDTNIDYNNVDGRYGDTSSITALLGDKGTDGLISLREAIDATNNTGGDDTIYFNISGTGVHTIALVEDLAFITDTVTIDATTESDYGSTPLIELDGNGISGSTAAFRIVSDNTTIKGFSIYGFGDEGIEIFQDLTYGVTSGSNNILEDNWIGLKADGTTTDGVTGHGILIADLAANNTVRNNVIADSGESGIQLGLTGGSGSTDGNKIQGNIIGLKSDGTSLAGNSTGISVVGGSTNNIIGTDGDTVNDANEGNVISASANAGIYLNGSSSTTVSGNYIGTDVGGTLQKGNGSYGIEINNSDSNTIGGSTADQRNVIVDNANSGISIWNTATFNNLVQGNYIGVNATGIASLGNYSDGIVIGGGAYNNTIGGDRTAGEGNAISGNIGASTDGIEIYGAGTTGNKVYGNYIGTNSDGTAPLGNGRYGVVLYDGAQNTEIGGVGTGEGNIIAGNTNYGVIIDGANLTNTHSNTIAANIIGLAADGTTIIANAGGILINQGAYDNTIGGNSSAARNTISGNNGAAVFITGTGTDGNNVQGNYIGTDFGGTLDKGNTSTNIEIELGASDNLVISNIIAFAGNDGIVIADSSTSGNIIQGNAIGTNLSGTLDLGNTSDGMVILAGASDNLIGGSSSTDGNLFFHNGATGIKVRDTATKDNSILGNQFFDNANIGIELGTDGVTNNDAGDSDSGANDGLNYPVITQADRIGTGLTVSGSIDTDGALNTQYRLEFYGNSAGSQDATNGEGRYYLGTTTVIVDSSGDATFSAISLPNVTLLAGDYVTATAARIADTGQVGVNDLLAYSETSEFSVNFAVTDTNDAPLLADGNLASTFKNNPNPNGQSIIAIFNSGFVDPDAGSSLAGLAVVGNTANAGTEGTWEYSSDGGANWYAIGSVDDATNALALDAATKLRFVSALDFSGSPTELTVRALDNSYAGAFTTSAGSEVRATISTSPNGGSTPIENNTTLLTTSISDEVPSLWLSTNGDDNSSGFGGLASVEDSDILAFTEPSLALGDVTTGTASKVFNIDAFTGDEKLNGLHYVQTSLTLGGTSYASIDVNRGDVIFALEGGATLTSGASSVSVGSKDVVLFSPDTQGDYSSGTFTVLLNDPAGDNIRGITLVESNTVVGDTTVNAGDFLLVTSGGGDRSAQLFQVDDVGDGINTVGTSSILISGDDTNIAVSKNWYGIHLVSNDTTIGGANLTEGQILITVDAATTVGTNNLAIDKFDIFALTITKTTIGAGVGNGEATASMFFDGSDVLLDSGSEEIKAIALAHINTAPTDIAATTTTINENTDTTGGYNLGALTSTDQDIGDTAAYSIVGGADAAVFTLGGVGSDELILDDGMLDFESKPSYAVTIRVTDSVGNTYDETLTIIVNNLNDAPVATEDRTRLDFDGVDDYVLIADSASLTMTNTMTMEAWIQPDTSANAYQMIMNKEGEYEVALFADGSLAWAFGGTDPAWGWINTGYIAADNEWIHIAVSYDNGVVNSYVNGSLVHTYNGSGPIGDANGPMDTFRIGGRENAPAGQYFDGKIDEVRVWNTARTQDEIQANLDANLAGNETGLAGYWKLNEGSGTTASDLTANANHGTLTDGAATGTPLWSAYVTDQDTPYVVLAADGVLANDVDADGDTLTVTKVNGAAIVGEITLLSTAKITMGSAGDFTYDPNGAFDYLDLGESAVDSFIYEISDGNGGTDTAFAYITITGINDTPTAGTIADFSVPEDSANSTIDLKAIFEDDEDTDTELTYSIQSNSNPGLFDSATINASKIFTLAYADDQNGFSDFTIRATDTSGEFVEVSFRVTVNPVNDAPVLSVEVGDSVAETLTETNSTLSVSDTVTVTDVDLTDLVSSSVLSVVESGDTSGIANATLLAMMGITGDLDATETSEALIWAFNSGAESFDYLQAGETLTLTYTVEVDDGTLQDTQTIVITINGSNDAPIISVETGDSVAETLTETNTTLSVSDTVTVTDVDLTDLVSSSVLSVTESGDTSGIANATLLAMMGVTGDLDATETSEALVWAFNSGAESFDYLQAGETLTLTYTVQVDDGTAQDTQTIVITINGSNDAPVLSVETGDSVAETLTETNTTLSVSDTVTVTDVDLTDLVSSSVLSVTETGNTSGIANATLLAMMGITGDLDAIETSEALVWAFNSGAESFDYLQAGETLTLTYTVQVDDGTAQDTQTIVITINGSNDAPILSVETGDSVAETLTETNTTLSVSDTVTVTDIDLTDLVSSSVLSVVESGDTSGIANATLLAMMGITGDLDATETSEALVWAFNSGSESFDYLQAGETLTLTYTVQVDDGTAQDTQTIIITINGSNDAPILSVETGDSVAETLTETNVGLSVSDTITVTDVDLTDLVSSSVLSIVESGDTSGIANATLLAMMGITGDLDATETSEALVWAFNSGAESFDYLQAGETLTLTYTVQVDDGTAQDTQTIVITINGSNDAPVLSVETGDSVAATLTESNATLSVSDTVTVTDIDLTDVVSSDVISVIESGDTSGIANATLLAMMGISGDLNATETSEALAWAFNSGAESFDYLQAGEALTLTYTVQVDDGTAQDTQTIVITINGSNDAPVLSVETGDSVAETLTETNTTLSVSDTVTVTDVDLTDLVSSSVISVIESGDTSGIANATLLAMMGISGDLDATETSEALVWAFNSGAENFDYLQAGEALTLTYTVEVDDGTAQDTQTIVITINGSNDAPVLTVETGDSVAETLTESNTTLSVSNTVTVTDVDLTDLVSSSVLSVVESGDTSGIANATLLAMMGISGDLDAIETTEALVWAFNSGAESFDYLQAGETLTLTYTTQVDDGTAQDTQTIVITINGSNDAPVLSVETGDSVAETLTETNTTLSISDTVTVTDLDLTDVVSSSVLSVVESGDTSGIANATLLAMMGITGDLDATETSEALVWAFNSGSESFDYLQAGETLTLTYTVEVDDGTAQDTQTIVITINGSNDAPVLSVETGDSVAETLTETNTTLSVSDTVTVTDLDLTDLVSSSVLSVIESGDTSGIANATLLAMMGISGDLDATETSEALVWAFNSGTESFDYLQAGETLTLTYTVEVDDGTAQDTQTIVITINGSNDAPLLSVETGDSVAETLTETNTTLSVSDTVTVTDVDLTDLVSSSVLSVVESGNTSGIANGTLLAMMGITGDLDATETSEALVWAFNSGAESFDYLQAGETLTLTYTVQVDDGTAQDTQTIVITINGSNDAPVLSVETGDSVAETLTETNTTLSVSDTVTVTDIDLTDVVSSSVLSVVETGDTSGIANATLLAMMGISGDLDATETSEALVWAFNSGAENFDYLQAGEALTLTYTVEVDDGTAQDTQTIVITINGSNDAPVLSVETGDSVAETLTETNTTLSVSDTVTVTDVDLTDLVSSDVISVVESGDTSGIANGTLLAMMGISGDLDATQTSEALVWTFNSGTEYFNYLQAGETLTLTYTVEVDDGTAQDTQTIVITINGSNDAPVLSVETGDSVAETLTETNTTLSVSDTVTVTDVDLTDLVSSSVLSVTESGDTSGIANATLLAMMGITGDLDATETSEALAWAFNSGAETFDYLIAGQTLTLTYTVQVNDGAAQDTQTIVISINGSNDAPVIGGVDTGAVTEDVDPDSDTLLEVNNALTIADPDASESSFVAETIVGTYGDLVIDAAGNWSYSADNTQVAIQQLDVTEFVTDTFTVTTADGSTHDIVITINGAEDAPTVDNAIPDQSTAEDSVYNYTFNANVFGDADASDTFTYAAQLSGGAALPSWLTFNDATRSFVGVPLNADVGFIDIEVIANDGSSTVSDVFRLTITNTDDAPVITGDDTGTVTEDVDPDSDTLLEDTGALNVVDPDAGESSFVAETIVGTYGDLVIDSAGSWSYSADNTQVAIQQLDTTESITDTLTVTTADGTTHDIVITINGSNDAPVLSVETGDSIAETLTETNTTLSVSDTITVTDVDLTDLVSSSVLSVIESGNTSGIANGTLLAMMGITGDLDATETSEALVWAFNSGAENFDYLQAGETLTLTYTVQVDDGTAQDTQTIVITINGSNDAPVLSVEAGDSVAETLTETNTTLSISDTVTVTDLDLTDVVSSSVLSVVESGDTSGIANATLLGMMGITGDLNATETTEALVWAFNSGAESFDYLQAGETLTLTYTVQVDDGTAQDTQTIVITINGSNDAPVLSVETGDSVAATLTESNATLSVSDTVTVTDIDLTDVVSSDVISVIESGDTSGIANATLLAMMGISGDLDATETSEALVWAFNSGAESFNYLEAGQTLTLTYTVQVDDGTAQDTQTIVITINGSSDAPVIGGVDNGMVTEDVDPDTDGLLEVNNALTIADPDAGQSSFVAETIVGTYGDLVIDAAGNWSYSADNTQAAIQSLDVTEWLTDTLTVTTADGSTHDIVITINGAEDAPVLGGTNTGTVAEDGTLIASNTLTITDTDSNDNPISYNDQTSIAGNNGYGNFVMSGNTWTYTLNNSHAAVQALDVTESLTDTFTFTATDGSSMQTVTVTIDGAEDAPTVDNAIPNQNATEDTAYSFTFNANSFGDVDTSDTLTYTAQLNGGGTLPTWLSFDVNTRTFSGTPLNADVGTISIDVIANDGSSTVTDTFTLTVANTDDAPIIGGVDTGAVTEDVDPDSDGLLEVSNALTIADPDVGESSFVAETIVGTYGDLVIDATGNWSYSADNTQAAIQQLDVSEFITDTLTVTTADGTTHDIVITINGAEDAPVLGGVNTGTVAEDGTLVASDTLTITDTDTNDNPISFNDQTSIAGSNGYGNFVMSGNTWTYTLNNNHAAVQSLDVSESLSDTFTFTASDGSSTQTVTVTINGAEDASVAGGTNTGSVAEDGTLVASDTLTITDVDSNDNPVSYNDQTSIAGDNGYGNFTMSGNNWTYTLANGSTAVQSLDAGQTVNDSFTFTASDGTTQQVTVTISGAEDAPTASDNTIRIDQNTSHTLSAGDFGFSDIDGDAMNSVRITALETAGDLKLAGSDVNLNDIISRADIDAGLLSWAPLGIESGDNYATFGFSVNDGAIDSGNYSITYDVTTLFTPDPDPTPEPEPEPEPEEPAPEENDPEPEVIATEPEAPPAQEEEVTQATGLIHLIDDTADDSLNLPSPLAAEAVEGLVQRDQDSENDSIPIKQFDLANLDISEFTIENLLLLQQPNFMDNDRFVDALDNLSYELDQVASRENAEYSLGAETRLGIAVSLSAGFVSWALRAGSLLASMFSVMPLWKQLDPLPIVGTKSEKEEELEARAERDESAENEADDPNDPHAREQKQDAKLERLFRN